MDWAALVHITDPLAHKTGMTMAFFTLSMAEIFHSFNMRSRRASLFSMGQNGYLWGAMVLSLVLSTVVLYVPALAAAFDFVPLSGTAYGASMALALAVIPVVELVKAQHEKAVRILTDNRAKLDELAQYLYQKETITGEEFMEILNREPAQAQ